MCAYVLVNCYILAEFDIVFGHTSAVVALACTTSVVEVDSAARLSLLMCGTRLRCDTRLLCGTFLLWATRLPSGIRLPSGTRLPFGTCLLCSTRLL
jgi:hypothetical protein